MLILLLKLRLLLLLLLARRSVPRERRCRAYVIDGAFFVSIERELIVKISTNSLLCKSNLLSLILNCSNFIRLSYLLCLLPPNCDLLVCLIVYLSRFTYLRDLSLELLMFLLCRLILMVFFIMVLGLVLVKIVHGLENLKQSWCDRRTFFHFREQLSVTSHGSL